MPEERTLSPESDMPYEAVRKALGNKFKNYTSAYEIKNTWRSSHALVGEVQLTKKKGKRRKVRFIAKRYVSPELQDVAYSIVHHPDFLFARELRNINLIRDIVGRGTTPVIHGASTEYNLIVMERLPGGSFRDDLVKAKIGNPGNNEVLTKLLCTGVEGVAQFVGECNAKKEEFYKRNPTYVQDADLLQKISKELFKEYLLRCVYHAGKPDLRQQTYDPDKVEEYLKKDKGMELDERLKTVWELTGVFNTRKILMHGDFNPDHLRSYRFDAKRQRRHYKVFDLEKFGLGEEVDDISSFCIVSTIGNNAIIDIQEFPRIINRYLAFESTYESGQRDHMETLYKLDNGGINEYLVSKTGITKDEYANFMLNFFAYAIRKNIQLMALHTRTEGQHGIKTAGYIKPLFQEVMNLDSNLFIDSCTNPKSVREYFYEAGKLLSDMDVITLDREFLEKIKFGTTAGNIKRELPEFKR